MQDKYSELFHDFSVVTEQMCNSCGIEYELREESYPNFWEMREDYIQNLSLQVDTRGSDKTIYDSPAINYKARVWHDFCHILRDLDFSLEGEFGVYLLQCSQIFAKFGGANEKTLKYCKILDAEVNGMAKYREENGVFPEDQRQFVTEYLDRSISVMEEE